MKGCNRKLPLPIVAYLIRSFSKADMTLQNGARSCVDISTYRTHRRNFLHLSVKPGLVFQSPWTQRTNYGLSHYCLEPFKWRATSSSSTFHIYPTGLRALRSQTWLRKIDARSCVQFSSYRTNSTQLLASIFRSHVWLRKALLSPKGKLWILALLLGPFVCPRLQTAEYMQYD